MLKMTNAEYADLILRESESVAYNELVPGDVVMCRIYVYNGVTFAPQECSLDLRMVVSVVHDTKSDPVYPYTEVLALGFDGKWFKWACEPCDQVCILRRER